jgi:4-amino-4-deoxy-L-arabinose transferase-like glycosyltransferase
MGLAGHVTVTPQRLVALTRWRSLENPAAAALVACAIFFYYLAFTPRSTLWDRDEPRFAQAAVEMAESRQYLYPTFNDEERLQKPILIYWLMSASIRTLGPTELAARIWSPLGLAIAAVFTYLIGRQLRTPREGLMAMTIVALNPAVMIEGTAATADAVLLAAITGALWASSSILSGGHRLGPILAAIACMTAAQLTKGPVGVLVPLLVTACALWLARRAAPHTGRTFLVFLMCASVSLLLFGAWAVPASLATGGRLVTVGFGREVLTRALSPMEGHGGNLLAYLPFYPLVVAIGFAPWSLYLPAAVVDVMRRRTCQDPARAMILAWIIVPLAMFTLAATKLPHYILPIWPALALTVAATLTRTEARSPGEHAWLQRGVWLFGAVALANVAVLAMAAFIAPTWQLRFLSMGLATILVGFSAAGLTCHRRGQFRVGAAWLAAGFVLLQMVIGAFVLPALETLKPVPSVAEVIRHRTPDTTPVVTYQFDAPSLNFYVHRSPISRLEAPDAVTAWVAHRAPGVLVTTRSAWTRLEAVTGPLELESIATAAGVDYSKGSNIEVVALQRRSR